MTNENIELVLLATTSNRYELDFVTSLLEENNIPYIPRDQGAGGYMKIIGMETAVGTDILVEKSSYDKAKELIGEI